jgi:type I restriction enzyme S subunit
MTGAEYVALSDQRYFAFISGLWTGDRGLLADAAVLRSTNFRGDGFFDYSDIAELQVRADQLAARKLEPGDIVIERSGGGPKQPVGRVAIFDPPDDRSYATSNFTTALRVVDRSAFDPHFLNFFLHYLYLTGATESLQRATTGIRNLDWAEYQAFTVPKLPMNEQRSVAKLLSHAYRGALVNDRQFETLAGLKRTAQQVLFTKGLHGEAQKDTEIGPLPESWGIVALGALGKIGSGTTPDRKEPAYWNGSIPWITSGRMYEREISGSEVMVTSLGITRSSLPLLQPGAILIAIVGQGKTLGHIAMLRCEATISRHVGYVQPNTALVVPTFLRAFLESQYEGLRQIASGNGSTRAALTAGNLRPLPVPLPPTLDEQREIVAILDAIDRKIDLHRRKRAVLDDLFKSLLQKLMTGEIRVADLDLSALETDRPDGAAA